MATEKDKAAEAVRQLKEATREAHEAIKELKNQRRELQKSLDDVIDQVNGKIVDAVGVDLDRFTKDLKKFQKDAEDRLTKRFDMFVQGPFDELAQLIQQLRGTVSADEWNQRIIEMTSVGNPLRRINRT